MNGTPQDDPIGRMMKQGRRELEHEHKMAADAANDVSMALGMWCGNGDYATFSPMARDRAGRRALKELNAAIDDLIEVRDRLARHVEG